MNEHKNIITIEDEIKEFSDKPVKSSALFKALEEKGVPDSSEASAGDVLSLDEDKKPTWAAPSGGGGGALIVHQVDNTCDRTWQEMYDAAVAGMMVVMYYEDADYGILDITAAVRFQEYDVDEYHVYFGNVNDPPFITDSPAGYPTRGGS